MCVEHGVVMALCTKHQPALIPVFQAKGDWCVEHGFPESICPQCHPEHGGRPAVDIALDGTAVDDASKGSATAAPRDGLPVRLRAGMAASVGLQTAPVTTTMRGPTRSALATIAYDATRVGVVTARAPGVVRTLLVDVGTRVKRGQVLGHVDSAQVGADRGALRMAEATVTATTTTLARQQALAEAGIGAQRDLQRAAQEHAAAQAALAAAQTAVGVVGNGEAGGYALTAPVAGVVVERHVNVGQAVGADGSADLVLFQIVDPSAMWAELDIQERDLVDVAVGQAVVLTFTSLPGRRFAGVLRFIAPQIDRRTRTAHARVAIDGASDNTDGALRAGLLGEASIATAEARNVVVVPRSAVQRVGDTAIVFVRVSDTEFTTRHVVLDNTVDGATGTDGDDVVGVKDGVVVGDVVVTTGSFLLKTETLKGAIGAGCCE